MELINYNDVLNATELALVWPGNEYYPPEVLNQSTVALLANISASKIQMKGAYGGDRQSYNGVFDKAYQAIWDLLQLGDLDSYLVIIEQGPKTPNRIRSFKGILPKKNLPDDSYIEQEVPLGAQSLIIACVKLDEVTHSEMIPLVGNFTKAFIIQSRAVDVFNCSFLSRIVEANLTSRYTIQYWSLLASVYTYMGKIYRLTGDGDTNVNVEVFYRSDVSENVKHDLEAFIRSRL